MSYLRQPIISVLGHVDHGKTSFLDKIRSSKVTDKEAGGITQHIGTTEIPKEILLKNVENLLKEKQIKIPGLLFIDTPGHEAFKTLRKRGGNICDLAILVIDINEGLKPQTIESIEILKASKTPFLIAANKLDLIQHFLYDKEKTLIQNIENQKNETIYELEEKVYSIVNKLMEFGYEADRFDRVEDFSKKVAIVPISATKNYGISQIISILIGLTQKFMEKKLSVEKNQEGKASIMEIKDKIGIGKSFDIILYDGKIKTGDFALTIDENMQVKKSYVKAIMKPTTLKDIRSKSTKFENIHEVYCSSGIKIICPNLENIHTGAPIIFIRKENEKDLEKFEKTLLEENTKPDIKLHKDGISIKADTIGSLEAIYFLLEEQNIKVRKAEFGKITKNDITDLNIQKEKNIDNCLLLNFHQDIDKEIIELAKKEKLKILSEDIIYKLVEKTKKFFEELEIKKNKSFEEKLIFPVKIKLVENCIFRKCNPAIIGVETILGTLKVNSNLLNEKGESIGQIKQIKDKTENLKELKEKEQAAISVDKLSIGKNCEENSYLYSDMPSQNFLDLKDLLHKNLLTENQISCMKEIAQIKRKENKFWGK